MRDRFPTRGAAYGIGAAALFGASTPIAKLVLGTLSPLMVAALLYCGAAALLGLTRLVWPRASGDEAALARGDVPALAIVTLAGGVAAPLLLMVGLARLPAVAAALLLNLEAVFTILLAVGLFREHLGRSEALGASAIIVGAVALAAAPSAIPKDALGLLCVAGACLCWAMDNNLTQRLSLRDPVAVARWKTASAGIGMLTLAALWGVDAPSPALIPATLGLGAASYGLSLVLDTHALRLLGAAREAAYFATAPFFGAALAVPLLGESLGMAEGVATGTMVLGVTILIRARHGHPHEHPAITHEHRHAHDEHHRHAHEFPVAPGTVHSHVHAHAPLVHDHAHVSDVHHRHRH